MKSNTLCFAFCIALLTSGYNSFGMFKAFGMTPPAEDTELPVNDTPQLHSQNLLLASLDLTKDPFIFNAEKFKIYLDEHPKLPTSSIYAAGTTMTAMIQNSSLTNLKKTMNFLCLRSEIVRELMLRNQEVPGSVPTIVINSYKKQAHQLCDKMCSHLKTSEMRNDLKHFQTHLWGDECFCDIHFNGLARQTQQPV